MAAPRGAPVAARPDVGLGIPPAIAVSREAAPRPRNGTLENLFLNGTESLNLSQTLTLGNLTLEDSARLSFGNPNYSATLTVEGSVFLYGRARLTIWDAYLTFASPYSDAQFLEVAANGSVILKDVDLTSGGHDWSARISQNGNLTVLGTAFGSWCVASFNGSAQGYFASSRIDADLQPSGSARLVVVDSAGPHLWLSFPNGSAGTLTLPAADVETNWSFPVAGSVSGVPQSIRLVRSWPGLFAVALTPGSRVAIENSSGVDLAFLPTQSTFAIQGLRFGLQPNLTVADSQFDLRLVNVSVASWSFYAVASQVTISDSRLGEVMGWSGSRIALTHCNLTDAGGYYAVFDTSQLSIEGSWVASPVVAYDLSRVLLENSTVDAPGDQSVLAVADGAISAINVTLDPGSRYGVAGNGTVSLVSLLLVVPERGTVPVPGARVVVRAAASGTVAAEATSGSRGVATFLVESGFVAAATNLSAFGYLVTAAVPGSAAEGTISVGGPAELTLSLQAIVLGTLPVNGTAGVAPGTPVSFQFGFPMNETATAAALGVTPAVPVDLAWDTLATGLVVTPLAGWVPGSRLTIGIGASAATAAGVLLGAPFSAVLSVAAGNPSSGAAPVVSSISPANGSREVPLTASVTIEFSLPMEPNATRAAFSLQPAVPTATLAVAGSALVWSGSRPLAAGTNYTVAVAISAISTGGEPLAAPFLARFRTVAPADVPVVRAWEPTNGSPLPGVLGTVSILWSVPMDPNATASAFSIVPYLAGTVTVVGTLLTFRPGSGAIPAVGYLAVVGVGARSAAGVPLAAPVWAEFLRPAAPSVPSSAPFPGGPFAIGALSGGAIAVGLLLLAAVGPPRRPGPDPGARSDSPPERAERPPPPRHAGSRTLDPRDGNVPGGTLPIVPGISSWRGKWGALPARSRRH